jgi:hypothetical protein
MPEIEALPASVQAILKNTGRGRDFISDHGFRSVTRGGVEGVEIKVRLTSYRALPLSCIEGLLLTIDDKTIDPSTLTITVNQHNYKLAELPALSDVWWFILDHATLFVPGKLAAGKHLLGGTLITVEPYVTAGRFSFYNSCSKELQLA